MEKKKKTLRNTKTDYEDIQHMIVNRLSFAFILA